MGISFDGETFKSLIKSKDHTVQTFAKKIGGSRAALHKTVSGKTKGIDFSTLDKMCTELGCSPSTLLRRN